MHTEQNEAKWCDVIQWQESALWTEQLITDAQVLRNTHTTIKIRKSETRIQPKQQPQQRKETEYRRAETNNGKHNIWRAGLSRSLSTETNKKFFVKMGQTSLTMWQGQQLHYLNKEHDVNLKWPQHNTANMSLLIKAYTWHVCWCCEIKQTRHSTVR